MMTDLDRKTSTSLTDAQIHEFFMRGWIVLRGLFDPDEIRRAQLCFENLVADAEKVRKTGLYKGSHFVLSDKGDRVIIHRVVWCGGAEPYLLELTKAQKVLGPTSQLLHSKSMDQLLCQAHFKLPGDGVEFDWHQDYQHRYKGEGTWLDVNSKGSYVQTLALIDDMTLDNGPVYFVPTPYTMGPLELGGDGYDSPTRKELIEKSVDTSKAVPVTGKAGDVVFFGPYTLHGSFANKSKTPRRVLISGYSYPGANFRVYPGEGAGRKLTAE